MQGSSTLSEEMQLGGFGLVLKVKEGDWILFFSDLVRNKAGVLGPRQAGAAEHNFRAICRHGRWLLEGNACLFAHTAGCVVLEPPREQGGTEKTWGTCIQYSWASWFPKSQEERDALGSLVTDVLLAAA